MAVNELNLLPEELSRSSLTPQLKLAILGFVVALVLVGAWYGWLFWQFDQTEQRLTQQKATTMALSNQILALENGENLAQTLETLKARSNQLQAQVHQQSSLLTTLKNNASLAEQGFADYLWSLSVNHSPELFLTRIDLEQFQNQRHVEIRGISKAPETIPLYLNGLENESIKALKFNALRVTERRDRLYDFALSTREVAP